MSQLLLELFCEEIPARLQAKGADDLQRLMTAGLAARGLAGAGASSFATPRRLTLVIEDIPAHSPAISEEKKGPRVGAPDGAIQGFLKSAGLASLDEATIVSDAKKGDFYVARIEKAGRPAAEIIAETVLDVIAKFPWPKTQRWGAGDTRWIRPMRGIVCLLGGKVVPFTLGDLTSGAETRGHRFHGNTPFAVTDFADYGSQLLANKVMLDKAERAESIKDQALAAAKKAKLALVPDDALCAENAGLTEWPTVLMGSFDESFLDVPPECLTTAMKQHQKCFSLHTIRDGKLANKFLLVSNLIAADGGAQIIAGNERVIRARLSDAKFFWDQDRAKTLTAMSHELAAITFHEKLGTQADRVERITELARQIAGAVDAEPELAGRAAQLSKADLVSGTVGEFPELQGLMGRYLAADMGDNPKIAAAIEEHYKPKGAGDSVPTAPVSIAVALADKLDTLVGFWAIGEKPTGSGDPYQLRRAALGVIRIVLENDLRLPLTDAIRSASKITIEQMDANKTAPLAVQSGSLVGIKDVPEHLVNSEEPFAVFPVRKQQFGDDGDVYTEAGDAPIYNLGPQSRSNLLAFFTERLKVYLRDQGARHDLVDAVLALPGQDDLALIVKRVDALTALLKTDDGANLLAGVKRASNILGIEEKKDKTSHARAADAALLALPEEKALHAAVTKVANDTRKAIDVERFDGAMRALAELRAPVDAFFDKVTVNDTDPKLRLNRLALLSQIRAATENIADFTKIAGS
jgi:glycyl-tRNA synthetase beta chain